MKKLLLFGAALLLLISFSTANAVLIGVKDNLGWPDIIFDNQGKITYTATTDKFILTASDWKIAYDDGTSDLLGVTDFKIDLVVDENGNLIGTGFMSETLTDGTITVSGFEYTGPVVLLKGEVSAFGWAETSEFEFLIDNDTLDGALVRDGIWPTIFPTGIYASSETAWDGTWTSDFTLLKVKGDKAPVPEPASMLLLGCGLIGLAVLGRKKFFKRS